MRVAPVSIAAIAYPDASIAPPIFETVMGMRDAGLIRVIDLMAVRKTDDGQIVATKLSDISEFEDREYGALIGALVGLGAGGTEGGAVGATMGDIVGARGLVGFTDEDLAAMVAEVPPGGAALVMALEHLWFLELEAGVALTGGAVIAHGFVDPEVLVAAGVELAATVEAAAAVETAAAAETVAATAATAAAIEEAEAAAAVADAADAVKNAAESEK
ncbi:MAG: DUF1269 domain-containing protein [Acidimicrobiia bacterium]|nr:DUF1269 domain-containing protein [Acidimicrobiia bacterium]